MVMTRYTHGQYTLDFVYQRLQAEERNQVIKLWVSSGVLPLSEAESRVDQVVMTIRNEKGELVGVNTAYIQDFQHAGNPYYFYRIFIREQDRGSSLRSKATELARRLLRDYRYDSPKPLGVVIVTENRKYERPGAVRLLQRQGWHYLGKGPRGFNVWYENFDGSEGMVRKKPGQ